MATIQEALSIAVEHHQAGRLAAAEGIYRQILAIRPDAAQVWYLLGALAHQVGRSDVAVDYIGKAIAAAPRVAGFHLAQGKACLTLRRFEAAVEAFRQAAGLDGSAETWACLGEALRELGQGDEAVAAFERSLAVNQAQPTTWALFALALIDAGRVDEGVATSRKAITLSPLNAAAWKNMAIGLLRQGKVEEADAACAKALTLVPELAPEMADVQAALASIRDAQGRLEEAIEAARRAVALSPVQASSHRLLGTLERRAGRLAPAAEALREAIRREAGHAAAYVELADLLRTAGQADEAERICLRGLEVAPDDAALWVTLGMARHARADRKGAVDAFLQAERRDPALAEVQANLGRLYLEKGRVEESILAFACAVELRPAVPEFHINLGAALIRAGCVGEAEAALNEALRLRPNHPDALAGLGQVQRRRGQAEKAAETLRKAVTIKTGDAALHSSRLVTLQGHSGLDEAALLAEAQGWDARHGRPFASRAEPHRNDRHPDRVLRIGYVSPDFGRHPVGFCLLPVLSNHDSAQVATYGYSDRVVEDDLTASLRSGVAVWRRTEGLSDDDVAQMIRDDGIDILVDLAGHTEGNRLGVFARKPAPVQVSWLGYPGTTGLSTIDYVLMDDVVVPAGAERGFAEEVVRLPGGRLCYAPPAYAPGVVAPPAFDRGFVTFGSFNDLSKLNPEVVTRWAAVLNAVPGSRLLLKWNTLCDGAERQRVAHLFAGEGIDHRRLDLRDASPHERMLSEYDDMDIALDPSPVGGGVTSLEAMWMGVPVVTLPGRRPASRQTLGLLDSLKMTRLGASGLDAATPQDYVRIAAKLAVDLPRLASLRARLRTRMANSGVTDGDRFARRLEIAYREMWRRWCGRNA